MKKLSLVFTGFLLASCGPQLVSPTESSGDNEPADGEEFVTVGVGVSQSEAGVFQLANATDFKMILDGCQSGLAYSDISSTNSNIDVYKFDQDCLVKLTEFTSNGITYVPKAGSGFTSWADNDIATFIDTADQVSGAEIKVVVVNQLENPVAGTETISYAFSQIQAGADKAVAESVVGQSQALSVAGQDAPNFTIAGVELTGMTTGGAGEFKLYIECNVALGDTNTTCDGLALAAIEYKLVADTYSGTMTLAEASTLFATAGSAPGTTINVGDASYANGGFESVTLTGPNQMHNNPNMILVLEADGQSYQYFNLDVSTLSYTP